MQIAGKNALTSGLLVCDDLFGEDTFCFYDPLFQQFFAAKYLVSPFPTGMEKSQKVVKSFLT